MDWVYLGASCAISSSIPRFLRAGLDNFPRDFNWKLVDKVTISLWFNVQIQVRRSLFFHLGLFATGVSGQNPMKFKYYSQILSLAGNSQHWWKLVLSGFPKFVRAPHPTHTRKLSCNDKAADWLLEGAGQGWCKHWILPSLLVLTIPDFTTKERRRYLGNLSSRH